MSFGRTSLLFAAANFVMCAALGPGCSSSLHSAANPSASSPVGEPARAALSIEPSSATMQAWQTIQFSLSGVTAGATCSWNSSDPTILVPAGDAQFEGVQAGTASISAVCGAQVAQAEVTVLSQTPTGPIVITSAGSYSGNWNSDVPTTAAVTIETDAPVTIHDSTVTSRGPLISVTGVTSGANAAIYNVTGRAMDPGVPGQQRGAFVDAHKINSLVVRNCTMTGVSFGVKVGKSTVAALQIVNNLASNLEDRASDGQGGLLDEEPSLGHFVIFNGISAPDGAEIGWNQVVQTMGKSSITDVINIYRSQGSSPHPIWVHDNYLEGASSPVSPTDFSGAGIIADGARDAPVTAFAVFQNNEVVHTAGAGVAIHNGHDIAAIGNRIVSCGEDAAGNWYARISANATSIWDGYGSGPSLFYNDSITNSAGGLVRPNASGNPMAADFWGDPLSMTYPGDFANGNSFTDPCLDGDTVNLAAEANESAYWAAKVAAANELIGDQHLFPQ